jgi:L-2-hydroxycarboxylate dehydrogenase (NAD+)
VLRPIDEIRDLMLTALKMRQIEPKDAELITEDYLDAELSGSFAHGLGKFLVIDHALAARRSGPVVVSRRGAVARIDGGREIGQLAARKAAELAAEIAQREGVGLVTLVNSGRYSRLAPYVTTIAKHDLAAIVTNNAGPRAVAPYGSSQPILGTNPIAFGFPGADGPFVIDFSTAQQVWGEIRQAVLEGRDLPADSFLDARGNPTVNPAEVDSVMPFGGHKGSALCLAIELLAGLVAGAEVGLGVENEYNLGALFIAFTLGRPTLMDSFATLSQLLADIRSSTPFPGRQRVLVPGDGSAARRAAALEAGCLDVEDQTLQILQTMAAGEVGMQGDRLTK